MRKFILVTLLAAASLAPAVAYAQDRDHEDRGRPRGNPGGWQQRQADGGGRPQQQQAPQQPRQFQQAQPQPPQAQQPRVAPEQQPRFQTPAYRGNPNWRGGDNGQPQNQPQVQVQPQNQPRNNWQGGRPNSNPQGRPNSQGRPDSRGDGDRNFGNTNGRHDDRDGDRRWNNNGHRDGDRRWNNGGNWSNNWRRDNRYDWRQYRNYNRDLYRLPRYYAPYGWNYGYRRFSIGVTLNSFLFSQNYWIDDPLYYRLPPAYGPYRWVRYYDDALLVNIYTGDVVDVVYDIFW